MMLSFAVSLLLTVLLATGDNWLKGRLEPFDLEVQDYPELGRGLRTTRPRPAGDVVLCVPAKDAITAGSIISRFPVLSKVLEDASSQLSHEQVLALGLIEMKRQRDEYAESMPLSQNSVYNLPEILQQCLPPCYQTSVKASKDTLRSFFKSLPNGFCTFDEVSWAMTNVRTRSVLSEDLSSTPKLAGSERMMLPGMDFLNHKRGATVGIGLVGNNLWQLVSGDEYQAGDQVFLSYGDRDNWKLLFTYGFVLPNNPDNIAIFDLNDLYTACRKARPPLFTEMIIRQLDNQLESVGGKGEDRAVFSYAKSGPRQSLLSYLELMMQVPEQLGAPRDDYLCRDILTYLLEQRRADLAQSRSKLEATDAPEGWDNFKSCLQTLVRDEIEILK